MLDPILLFTHTAVSFSFLILHSHTFVLGLSQSFSQLSFSLLGRQEKSCVFYPLPLQTIDSITAFNVEGERKENASAVSQ